MLQHKMLLPGPDGPHWLFVILCFSRLIFDKITFIYEISPFINVLWNKEIMDISDDTDLVPDCDTDIDLSDIGG